MKPVHPSASALCVFLMLTWSPQCCYGMRKFGFDFYHRFSEHVKRIIPVDDLPDEGSIDYFVLMANRDRFIHARRLSGTNDLQPLTFLAGNMTRRMPSLGNLYYGYISIGTPALSFFVALDTGSDLLWLPCDCVSCLRSLKLPSGDELNFNIYRPHTSATSVSVLCNSSSCPGSCTGIQNTCPYEIVYLSANTSSNGTIVEDVLHLTSDVGHPEGLNASIILGCSLVQTGSFLEGAAPNGLFGLGLGSMSVPSILANKKIVADSFSMCFGDRGNGRIVFGDKGSLDQRETPFYSNELHPAYTIRVARVGMGSNISDNSFSAIFDSGTSFTYLNGPAYVLLSEMFHSRAQGTRISTVEDVPFEYCYDLGFNPKNFVAPTITLEMEGGKRFKASHYVMYISSVEGRYGYCLGVFQSGNVDIIGQNFMTGYNIVFDRELNILGWKASNCSGGTDPSKKVPTKPKSNTTSTTSASAPPITVVPQAAAGNGSIASHSELIQARYISIYVILLLFFISSL